YDAARPTYPDPLIAQLIALSGIPPDGVILEVGAGPGKATVPLARHGRAIIAIEPGPNLIAVLRRNVAGSRVDIEQTTFEAWTPREPVDLVVAAESFRWVKPSVRYAKAAAVLRPGGALALLGNEKADMDPALRDELDAVYAEHFPPSRPMPTVDEVLARVRAEIEASGCFGDVIVRAHPWTAVYTTAEYVRLLDTYSDHVTLAPARRERLYAAVAAVIDRRGGSVTIPYVAVMHLARAAPGRSRRS
ncbi:MAG TPA: class I SAM-dependent methyltransferase, partial [Kofleriaceae bacterium]|nr:class I SAM-dependent methyltransferase [Kofleriaceae bacterium]